MSTRSVIKIEGNNYTMIYKIGPNPWNGEIIYKQELSDSYFNSLVYGGKEIVGKFIDFDKIDKAKWVKCEK